MSNNNNGNRKTTPPSSNSNPSKNSKSPRNRRRRSNGSGKSSTQNGSKGPKGSMTSKVTASAMSIPQSRRHQNRRSALSKQMRSSLADSTYGRTKRSPLTDLKPNAPFNPLTSFYSQCSPDELFHELVLALKSLPDLDVDIHRSCYKIRGRKFIANTLCEFQLELFHTTPSHPTFPSHILVEFQRRNGDGFVFQKFLESVFRELRKTKVIAHCQFPENNDGENDGNYQNDEEKVDLTSHFTPSSLHIDDHSLQKLLRTLFDYKLESELRRTAANYLSTEVQTDLTLVDRMARFEPLIISKISDLLLRSMDPQLVRSVGICLCFMMEQSDSIRAEAMQLNVKKVCQKTYKRWTEPVEQRYGKNDKYVIRVIPSLQVAQRMSACIEVLE